MASYLYYHKDLIIISDAQFDRVCRSLEHNWLDLDHPHMSLILPNDEGQIASGFHLSEKEYPSIVKHAALRLYDGR